MLNSKLKLNSKIFNKEVEKKPIRSGYGEGLVEAGKDNENVVVFTADLTESTRAHLFAEKFPDRFFNVGVAEQNMATIAAGMGISGKIPFISSYAAFSPGRNWEQIRTTISYNDSNVKIVGHHAGVSTGPDGATHQATEDIAIMRVMANMRVFVPCDFNEAKKATLSAAKLWGPVYIRCARADTPVLTTESTPFDPGKADIFWESKKPEVVIIACGTMVHTSLVAAKELEDEKIGTIVINNHTIKPLDEKTILKAVDKVGAVVTAEEHNVVGGMGSAVAELLAKNNPTPIEFIGVQDVFGESGLPEELSEKYEMGVEDIKKAAKRAIKRKK
ncbi:MAG: transketolase C-terminal domain-containing protein [Candidatus Paceibacterota bacterium]